MLKMVERSSHWWKLYFQAASTWWYPAPLLRILLFQRSSTQPGGPQIPDIKRTPLPFINTCAFHDERFAERILRQNAVHQQNAIPTHFGFHRSPSSRPTRGSWSAKLLKRKRTEVIVGDSSSSSCCLLYSVLSLSLLYLPKCWCHTVPLCFPFLAFLKS